MVADEEGALLGRPKAHWAEVDRLFLCQPLEDELSVDLFEPSIAVATRDGSDKQEDVKLTNFHDGNPEWRRGFARSVRTKLALGQGETSPWPLSRYEGKNLLEVPVETDQRGLLV